MYDNMDYYIKAGEDYDDNETNSKFITDIQFILKENHSKQKKRYFKQDLINNGFNEENGWDYYGNDDVIYWKTEDTNIRIHIFSDTHKIKIIIAENDGDKIIQEKTLHSLEFCDDTAKMLKTIVLEMYTKGLKNNE